MDHKNLDELLSYYSTLRHLYRLKGPAKLKSDSAGRLAVWNPSTHMWDWYGYSGGKYRQTGSSETFKYWDAKPARKTTKKKSAHAKGKGIDLQKAINIVRQAPRRSKAYQEAVADHIPLLLCWMTPPQRTQFFKEFPELKSKYSRTSNIHAKAFPSTEIFDIIDELGVPSRPRPLPRAIDYGEGTYPYSYRRRRPYQGEIYHPYQLLFKPAGKKKPKSTTKKKPVKGKTSKKKR